MKIRPEQLESLGYARLERLDHQSLVPFVQEHIRRPSRWRTSYLLANLLFAAILACACIHTASALGVPFSRIFTQVAYGAALTFLLIPLHEGIHGLAYRICGARSVSFDANWRKFYFMALAHRFVANQREFRLVALAPFLSISLLLIALSLFTGPEMRVTWNAALLIHAAFCGGDFALLAFFASRPDLEILTYDDREEGMSYFYGRPRRQQPG